MPRRPHLTIRSLRGRLRPSLLLVAGGAAFALLLSGCGGDTVEVGGFTVSRADREACSALLAALPTRVADQKRVPVDGDGRALAAAWGDPAIVLRCGVGKPADYDKFAACMRANGVDWFVPERILEDQSADVLMTTIGRSPAVEVRVPAEYRPTTGPMVDLAKAVKAHTREVAPCS